MKLKWSATKIEGTPVLRLGSGNVKIATYPEPSDDKTYKLISINIRYSGCHLQTFFKKSVENLPIWVRCKIGNTLQHYCNILANSSPGLDPSRQNNEGTPSQKQKQTNMATHFNNNRRKSHQDQPLIVMRKWLWELPIYPGTCFDWSNFICKEKNDCYVPSNDLAKPV